MSDGYRPDTVQSGDYYYKIAQVHGFLDTMWEVWNHPLNASHRAKREKPSVLYPGDIIWIPDLGSIDTLDLLRFQRNRYVATPASVRISVRFLDHAGEPHANLPFEVREIDGTDEPLAAGVSDSTGLVSFDVSATVSDVVVSFDPVTQFTIAIGALNPVEEESGVRQRLRNLGYLVDEDDDIYLVMEATSRFQADNGLPETGEADTPTRAKLVEVHGS